MKNKHGENVIYRAIIKMPSFSGHLFTTTKSLTVQCCKVQGWKISWYFRKY